MMILDRKDAILIARSGQRVIFPKTAVAKKPDTFVTGMYSTNNKVAVFGLDKGAPSLTLVDELSVVAGSSLQGNKFFEDGSHIAWGGWGTNHLKVTSWDGSELALVDEIALASGCDGLDVDTMGVYIATTPHASPYVQVAKFQAGNLTIVAGAPTLDYYEDQVAWFDNNTKLVAVGNSSQSLTIFNWSGETLTRIAYADPYDRIYSVTCHPSINYIACSWPSNVRVYYLTIENILQVKDTKGIAGTVNDLSWSRDGKWLAVAHGDSPYLSIFEWIQATETLSLKDTFTLTGAALACCWSYDGDYLAVDGPYGGNNKLIFSWDGSALTYLCGNSQYPSQFAVSWY